MKRSFNILAAGMLCAAQLAPASAKELPEKMEIIVAPATIRSDRAYFLLRIRWPIKGLSFEPIFLRVPTVPELDQFLTAKRLAFENAKPGLEKKRAEALQRRTQAENGGRSFGGVVPPEPDLETFAFRYDGPKNVWAVNHNKPLVKNEGGGLFLVEVLPGNYVLYGVAYGVGSAGIHTCWCLGTVGFSAQAGEITNLGTFIADTPWQRSAFPELAEETGLGHIAGSLIAATIVPPADDGSAAGLGPVKIVKATYHAEGKFLSPNAYMANRLAPVPGILAYQREHVVDVQSGKVADDHY